MKSKAKHRAKPGKDAAIFYSRLSPEELDKIAEPYEREFVPSKPLTPAMRAQERRARRKRGRPIVGEGAAKVLVSMERGLLRETDAYAKKHNKNRSQVIVESLRAMLMPMPKRRAS